MGVAVRQWLLGVCCFQIGLVSLPVASHTVGHAQGPLGRIEHHWHPDPAIKSVFSLNFDFHAGANIVSWSPAAQMTEREGRRCVQGAYVLFDVDDDWIFDTDEAITVELTFYRPDTDGYVLSWDHAIAPMATQHSLQQVSTERSFYTETVVMERARFANRKYYGSDFAVAGVGSQLTHPEGAGEVVLCGLRLLRTAGADEEAVTSMPPASLTLQLSDEHGGPTAARVGLYRADGWSPSPSDDALLLRRYSEETRQLPLVAMPRAWPEHGRYVFFVDGLYQASVPPGEYELVVMKGPEYALVRRSLVVAADESLTVDVPLTRWVDQPARGWLSGDVHIHIGREDAEDNPAILNFMRAEDIRVANLLEMGNLHDSYFKQYAFGAAGVHSAEGYYLVSGQESPRTSHRGHTIGLNTQRFHWPQDEYFFYDKTSDAVRAEGGLWGYAHVAIEAFNVHYGLALDVPRGKVDFVEMMQFGVMNTRYLYDFLNMGFRLLPGAGSDYPYIGFPGAERLYVQAGALQRAEDWFQALKHRRSYVTNWLTLDLAVNGDTKAVEYLLTSGESLRVVAQVRANPDFDTLDRVELVLHGEVIATVSAADAASDALLLEHEWIPSASQWFAIRAYGRDGALLHSAPLYVLVDGDADFSSPARRGELAVQHQQTLKHFLASQPSLDEEWERHDVENEVHAAWERVRPQLTEAIHEAMAVYQDLIDRAQ